MVTRLEDTQMHRTAPVWLLVLLTLAACNTPAINVNRQGVAVDGFDVVAYFTDGDAVKGTAVNSLKWQGATWYFATAAHRDAFRDAPEKYAPQYGGYCAWAVAHGKTAGVDPRNAWKIVDGKLYLNYDREIQEKWAVDIPGNIAKADRNWPAVVR